MALTGTQLSLDLGNTAWGTLKSVQSLLRAASVDDVQPIAVTAMAQLGQKLVVDPRLIGPASEALGGDNSIRLEQIKLSMGIMSGGVASEMRQQSTTVRAFLLISALGSSMSNREVSEVLNELLLRSKIIDDVVIGPTQLLKLIEAIEGNSQALFKEGHMSPEIFDPIATLASSEGDGSSRYFSPLAANLLAEILLDVFSAIWDEDVGRIRITGSSGAVSIIGVLRWLCPDQVEVRSIQEDLLVESSSQPAKVTIILDRGASSGPWKKEIWYSIETPNLVHEDRDDPSTYRHSLNEPSVAFMDDRRRLPSFFLHTLWQLRRPISEYGISQAANYGLGLVNAVLQISRLERDDIRGIAIAQSRYFREICSLEFLSTYMDFPTLLGFPKEFIDPQIIQSLGNRFTEDVFTFEGDTYSLKTLRWLESIGEEFRNGNPEPGLVSKDVWYYALQIADLALLSATRTGLVKSLETFPPQETEPNGFLPRKRLVTKLLGPSRSFKASKYLQLALLAAHGSGVSVPENPLIAIGGHGRVCYLSSFIQPPLRLREAFQITLRPGQLRWRNASIRYLYDVGVDDIRVSSYRLPAQPDPMLFPIDIDTRPNPTSLQVYDSRTFKYFLTAAQQDGSARLFCERQNVPDPRAIFTTSLINWALALRATPSGRGTEDLLRTLEEAGISTLNVKHPASRALHCLDDTISHYEMRALATFNDSETRQFLLSGTMDTHNLRGVIQGEASLLDTIVQAVESYDACWIIMTNP